MRWKSKKGMVELTFSDSLKEGTPLVSGLIQNALSHHQAGRLQEAEAIYQSILQEQPQNPRALHLLGVIAHQVGKNEIAVDLIEKAISINPDYVDAHYNLGVTLQELGRHDGAIAHYKQVLTIKPNYAEAHNNMGGALKELGRLDDAITRYEHALAIKPNYAEAHYNLGVALQEQGKYLESFSSTKQAINLDRQNDAYWQSFANLLERFKFNTVDDNLLQDLSDLLDRPTVSPKTIASSIISAIRCHLDFVQLLKHVNSEDVSNTSYEDVVHRLSSVPLLLKLMTLSSINDLEIEKVLIFLRRSMLLELQTKESNNVKTYFKLFSVLALHCFANEYIFQETIEEKLTVELLNKNISRLLEDKQEVLETELVVLACYRPLYQYPWANLLLERDWSDDFKMVIMRQVKEPLEEKALRVQIPNITPIQDSISQAVQSQYEENPYPIWTKADLPSKTSEIKDLLQRYPFNFDLEDYISPKNPEILIAGCGTGHHALLTSSRFTNARVLAVDISLTSLSYALRKTNEYGFSNIEYAQADIMELNKIDRKFDLIESVGVLHHMKDPLAGWQVLTDLLRPGGVMKIGLYSKLARSDVIRGRSLVDEKGYSTSPEDIRRCRQDIITMIADGNRGMEKLTTFTDFFHLSEFRDLLFHVQEHHYTIPQIENEIQHLGLVFLGFETRNKEVMKQFKSTFPERSSQSSLPLWHEFESQNPDMFRRMYQFWVKKI